MVRGHGVDIVTKAAATIVPQTHVAAHSDELEELGENTAAGGTVGSAVGSPMALYNFSDIRDCGRGSRIDGVFRCGRVSNEITEDNLSTGGIVKGWRKEVVVGLGHFRIGRLRAAEGAAMDTGSFSIYAFEHCGRENVWALSLSKVQLEVPSKTGGEDDSLRVLRGTVC